MDAEAAVCCECGAPMTTLGDGGRACSSLLCPTNLADLDERDEPLPAGLPGPNG